MHKQNTHKQTHIEYYGISDIGLMRESNEDVWAHLPAAKLLAVADGMGGHPAGEIAAQIAMSALCRAIKELLPFAQGLPIEDVAYHLKEAVGVANRAVFQTAAQQPQLSGMGTTLSSCIFYRDHLLYAHVGDCRLYRRRGPSRGNFEQLTKDHLSNTNKITRAIGTSFEVIPEIGIFPIYAGDLYLLCSDGLTNSLSDEEIEGALASTTYSLSARAKKLLAKTKARGGRDNTTLILAEVKHLE